MIEFTEQLEVLRGSSDCIGDTFDNGLGHYTFHAGYRGGRQITSEELRQIADKLDELNGVEK